MNDKLYSAGIIILFWFIFPFIVMLTGESGFNLLNTEKFGNMGTPTLLGYLSIAFTYIVNYFVILSVWIPNAPLFINLIVLGFRIFSGLIIFVLIRGH